MRWLKSSRVSGQAQAQDKCRQAAKARRGCGAGEALDDFTLEDLILYMR